MFFTRVGAAAINTTPGAMRGNTRKIIEAINVLEHSPMLGRPVNNDKRELVIGHRSHGFVALYRYIVEVDTVFVLAVRSQREAGYVEAGRKEGKP